MTVEEWKRKNPPIKRKPLTNADFIRQMTDKELAEFLQWYMDCTDCPIKCDSKKDICYDKMLEWLKKEE